MHDFVHTLCEFYAFLVSYDLSYAMQMFTSLFLLRFGQIIFHFHKMLVTRQVSEISRNENKW